MPFPTFATKEEIPAGFASEYEEKDGKWVAKPPADELGEAGKAALEKERKAKKAEKDRADVLAAENERLKTEAEAAEKGITKDVLDKIRADEAAKAKPLQDENAALKSQLRKVTLNDRVQALALKSGVLAERIEKAMKDLDGRVDLTEDGQAIVVKDAKGNVTTETIEDFLAKTYKAEAPFFYAGTNASGSGADGGTGGGDTGGYDPVKAGKDAAAAQKKGAAENALAFK